MSIHDCITLATTTNNMQALESIVWVPVSKEGRKIKVPRGIGEAPFQAKVCHQNHPRVVPFNEYRSLQILSSIREATGGYYTQSNEIIEKCYKQRQNEVAKKDSTPEKESSNACSTTTSSDTTDSYKTTTGDQYESTLLKEEITSQPAFDMDIDRYKKNALMMGLITKALYEYIELDEISRFSLSDCLNDSVVNCAEREILDQANERLMREERLNRLFQSQGDQNILCNSFNKNENQELYV